MSQTNQTQDGQYPEDTDIQMLLAYSLENKPASEPTPLPLARRWTQGLLRFFSLDLRVAS